MCLLKNNVDLEGVLSHACYVGDLKLVNNLLKNDRISVSELNNSPIIMAVKNERFDVVDRLLKEKNVNPSDQHNKALKIATENGNLEMINKLLEDRRFNNNKSDIKEAIEIASTLEGENSVSFIKQIFEDIRTKLQDYLENLERIKEFNKKGFIHDINRKSLKKKSLKKSSKKSLKKKSLKKKSLKKKVNKKVVN